MKNTKIRILKSLVTLLIAALIAFGATYFVVRAADFTIRHLNVADAEREGETATYTANGPQTWLPSENEAYNQADASRAELVAESDIAKFLFDCGGSHTGEVVRVLVCIVVVLIDGLAIWYGYNAVKAIFKGTRRLIRWTIREKKTGKRLQTKNSNNQENNIWYEA